MATEIYKDIKGYEGLYQVSNLGNVKSLYREFINTRGSKRFVEECILRQNKKRTGYIEVALSIKGEKKKCFLVHRLVASAFLEKCEGKKDVNHKDGDKTNNRADNLEWCTKSENTKHAFNNNLSGFRDSVIGNLKAINEKTSYKKIIFIKGSEIIEFKSTSEASKMLGLDRDNITRAIRKNQKVGGWQVFGYKVANEEILTDEKDNLVGK